MENTGYNLRQRPFPVSTTADSLATIATSSVSILSPTMSYPASSSTGGSNPAPTIVLKSRCGTIGPPPQMSPPEDLYRNRFPPPRRIDTGTDPLGGGV